MPKRNTELAVEIGSRIAARRKELKWTQEEAAERAGLSHQFLACAERGIKGIGAESILKLCKAMDISADYLLAGCMTPAERDYLSQLLAPMSERHLATAPSPETTIFTTGPEVMYAISPS